MSEVKNYADITPVAGMKFVVSGADASQTTGNADIDALATYLGALVVVVAAPASAGAAGVAGQVAIAAGYFYTCVATNTWQRVATATW